MDDPLIIPARDWVGSVPAGVSITRSRDGRQWVLCGSRALPPGWAIELSPPPLDADGYPTRMDALPVVRERLGMLLARTWPDRQTWARRRALGLVRPGPALPFTQWNPTRAELVALLNYRGPDGERPWEVAP